MMKQTTCYSCDKPIEPEWLPEGEFIVCDECSSDTDEKRLKNSKNRLTLRKSISSMLLERLNVMGI